MNIFIDPSLEDLDYYLDSEEMRQLLILHGQLPEIVKLNEVNMRLAMLGMSMENSDLKHTQQYKDLISIVEYIGMDFKPI